MTESIIATKVPEAERLDFLPNQFGPHLMMEVERTVFTFMGRLCADYDGGYWKQYTLSNGGCFMVPERAEPLTLKWPMNGYEGSMSAEAAGIVATLFALSHLAFKYEHSRVLTDRFHQLRNFALEHPERREILAAID